MNNAADAAQHEVMRRRSGAVPGKAIVTILGQQRAATALRCARDTQEGQQP
jgi:hypothetical protein